MTHLSIANDVAAHREARGWSQERLARHAGYTRQFICLVECGSKTPRIETLKRIAEALGCELKITMEPRR